MFFKNEKGYLELLKYVLDNGEKIKTRNGDTISILGNMIEFDNININLPILTTKKIFFKGVIEELLWFLKGHTNAKYLKEKNVHIWDGNSTREFLDKNNLSNYEENELGPIYGWQWRNFGKKYKLNGDDEGFDQIKYILEELSKNDNSRRAILSAWNPLQLKEMALPPCHILYNFYKNSDGLSCMMTMRSSDLFLGLPFNILSTAILTIIIAKVLHINVSKIKICLADTHIYEEHIEAVNIQLNREIIENNCTLDIIKEAPDLNSELNEKINWINNLNSEDFKLNNYKFHSPIKANMK
jgi:thymidylate synthase